jgi:hypothetical protein
MATCCIDDSQRNVKLADGLVGPNDQGRSICLLQCGRESASATEYSQLLTKLGRHVSPLVIKARELAQSDTTLNRVAAAGSVWVFAEDLLETFFTVFSTRLAFALRAKSRDGFPVIGIGQGALALGGLLLANRICRDSHYDLVSGLGWAPRVIFDGGEARADADGAIARTTVRSLPGLLGVDLRVAGGIRVEGGRVESIGREPVRLLGGGDHDSVLMLELEPGRVTTIAPPPFAPFERGLLPTDTLRALTAQLRSKAAAAPAPRQAPPPQMEAKPAAASDSTHAQPGSGRVCPMCKKVHPAESTVALAA